MFQYRISFVIDGLHDVIPNKEDTLQVADVIFHHRETERVGTISLETNDKSQAKILALEEIDKSLSKLCFAYNTEASIKKDGLYLIDLTKTPTVVNVEGTFTIRLSHVKWPPEKTMSMIEYLTQEKKDFIIFGTFIL